MKKFVCAAAVAAVGLVSVISFGGCKTGEAHVEYALSEGGDYYIVSGVSGDRMGLKSYDVPATYSESEGGQALPVKEIGYEAFFKCRNLTSVTLPDTIEVIGERAFAYCSFENFVIPDGVKTIKYAAFGVCESLTEITIPESVTTLESRAFIHCSGLEKAYVKADITVLEDSVFYNNVLSQGDGTYTDTSLKAVYLSDSITKIRNTALSGNGITDIYYAGSEEQWNALYFYNLVDDAENPGKKKENRLEKSAVLSKSVKVTCGKWY